MWREKIHTIKKYSEITYNGKKIYVSYDQNRDLSLSDGWRWWSIRGQFTVMKTVGNRYTLGEVCPWNLVPHTLHFMSPGPGAKEALRGQMLRKIRET